MDFQKHETAYICVTMEASTNVMRNQLINRQKSLTKKVDSILSELNKSQKVEYEFDELKTIGLLAAELQNATAQLKAVENLLADWKVLENEVSSSRSEPQTTSNTPNSQQADKTAPEATAEADADNEKTENAQSTSGTSEQSTETDSSQPDEPQPDSSTKHPGSDAEVDSGSDQKNTDERKEETENESSKSAHQEVKSDSQIQGGSDTHQDKRLEEIPPEVKEEEALSSQVDKPNAESKKTHAGQSHKKFSLQTEPGFTDQLGNNPLKDLKEAIGLNERFLFSNELFNGNMEAFNRALNELNHLQGRADAERLINEQLAEKHKWNPEDEAVERFILLVKRRFAA